MQDLSHLLRPDPVGALAPTAQAAPVGTVSTNERAMTAPGSEPPVPAPAPERSGPPDITAETREVTVTTRGEDTGLRGGRPVLVRGGWNDMGGGPAPEGYRR